MTLAKEVERFLAPLAAIFSDPWQAADLLWELGLVDWHIDDLELPGALTDLAGTASTAMETLSSIDGGDLSAAEITLQTIEAASAVMNAVQALQDMANGGLGDLPFPFNGPETWQELARALPAYLFARWLRSDHLKIRSWLRLAGALDANGEGGESINFGALSTFLTNPPGGLAALTVEHPEIVLDALRDAAFSLGAARRGQQLWYSQGAAVELEPARSHPTPPGFWLSLLGSEPADNWVLDFDVAAPDSGDPGVQVLGTVSGSAGRPIALSDVWSVTTVVDANETIGFVLTPSGPAPAPGAAASDLTLTIAGTPASPWSLIGSAEGSHLELSGLTLEVRAEDLVGTPDLNFEMRTEQMRLVIQSAEGDSFLRYVLGGGIISADSDFQAGWSPAGGFTFGGSAGLDVTIPVHRSLGPVTFETMRLLVSAGEDGLSTEVSAWIGLALGPLDVVLDGIGFAVTVAKAAAAGHGLFGDLDFVTVFKPPDGIGLAIEAGPVSGGGIIYIDREAGEYEGILDLNLFSIGICAVGLIDTKLPGGGWSLFFALFIDLPSIPLGFGFTLNGVGGVAGINRTLDVEGLRSAINSGSLDSVLFPENPIVEAPIIIDTFKEIFPSAEGRFVFGPVIQIGWGSPTLIEAEIGVVISLPDPITIAVLGSVTAVLPTEDTDLVALHLEVAGIIDMGTAELSIDASLHGSHIAGFPLSGDMALRSAFGDSPSFLMALGGSHPGFDRPPAFPIIERLALGISAGSWVDIRFQCYFAISSNSLQFGAAFEMTAEVEGFGISGGASFDALVTFSPFSLRTDLGYHISVRAAGVDLLAVWLEVALSGPNPWRVVGEATFTILGIDNTIHLDIKIGSKKAEELPESVDVLAQLRTALSQPEAWSIGAGGGQGVTFKAGLPGANELVVTPDGTLGVSQKVVPLDITIDKADPWQVTGGYNYFDLEAEEPGLSSTGSIKEWFAVSAYMDLKPNEQLSAPSFEQLKAGITFGGGEPAAGQVLTGTMENEQILRDPELREESVGLDPYNLKDDVRKEILVEMATGQTARGFATAAEDVPRVVQPGYTVTDRCTGQRILHAQKWMASRTSKVGRQPNNVVVPTWEVEA